VAAALDTGGIAIEVHLDILEIYADPLIEKVLFNLVDNSLRYGGGVSRIRLYAGESDRTLLLIYEDDGAGIPYRDKRRIFERGYGRQTGLGLFLAREILSITGLSIRETGMPGAGARFEIAVPPGLYRYGGGRDADVTPANPARAR